MYVVPARPIDEKWAQNLCVNTDNLTGVTYKVSIKASIQSAYNIPYLALFTSNLTLT